MENKIIFKYISIIIGIVLVTVVICFYLMNMAVNKKIKLIEGNIVTSTNKASCIVHQAKYPFPYGNTQGLSTQKAELKCLPNEHLVTGGCEVVLGGGAYADFGGVENTGYLLNRPNDNGTGWLCGFFGGQKGSYDSKSFINAGVWDLNIYVYCCE